MTKTLSSSPPPSESLPPPTRVRYLVVLLATLAAVLLYLDRICLSFTERYITEDLGLSSDQAGLLLSAFFWAYAVGQVPSGWLGDRLGVRWVLALYILSWSAFTGLLGVAHSFLAVLAFRFGCGLAQAGAYPTSASLLSKWVPFSARAQASAVVATGGRVGGFLAPVLTAYLMVAFVPVNEGSLLRPDDLLNAAALCRNLCQADDSPAARLGAAIRARLPASTAALVQRAALADPKEPLAASEQSELVEGLNEVLKQPSLCPAVDPGEYPLSAEARWLAQVPEEQLTAQQIERRNRLLLEAAYPDQVRKVYGKGWRPVMLVYGLAGVVAALVFWLGVRDRPGLHPACNQGEVRLIESGQHPGSGLTPTRSASEGPPLPRVSDSGKSRSLPLLSLLRSGSLWLSSISQFATNLGWVFLITWFPRYLAEVHRVPVLERGWMASLPLLLGMAGMLAGGWVTDRLTRRVGLRWGRALPMGLTRFAGAAAFAACVLLHSPWSVTAALCVVAITTDLGVPAVWAFMQDVGGRHVGSVLGWGNMWGNVGAAVSPVLLNLAIDAKRWDVCFLGCAVAFLVAGIAALGIDATRPIVPVEGEGEGK
jgi:MFS transporter, ACS family, glucarate transporter